MSSWLPGLRVWSALSIKPFQILRITFESFGSLYRDSLRLGIEHDHAAAIRPLYWLDIWL